jgi:prepilin-type N-terminal cleavage/methylation domain-containing protein
VNAHRRFGKRCQRGFTLVEMMIALALGLLVAAAVTSIVVNISTSASESTVYARSSQDMRTVLGLMARELRRAGYNIDALSQVGRGVTSDLHSRVLVGTGGADTGDCITFGYDTLDIDGIEDSTPGEIGNAEPSEWRGFRRQVIDGIGVVQMRISGDGIGADCDSGGHVWVDLTDRERLDVTALDFDMTRAFEGIGGNTPDPDDPVSTVTALIGVRPVVITLRARVIDREDSERELRQWVRVRAETARLIAASP